MNYFKEILCFQKPKLHDITEVDNTAAIIPLSLKPPAPKLKPEEEAPVTQARSWTEVIEKEDLKNKKVVQGGKPDGGKKVKKKKVDKDLAGYKKRRKRKKKLPVRKMVDVESDQKPWSPCPSENFSIEYDNDDIDYGDFSFDQPHTFVETLPNSDDDSYSYGTESVSMTSLASRPASPAVELAQVGVHRSLDVSSIQRLQPKVELTDYIQVSGGYHMFWLW